MSDSSDAPLSTYSHGTRIGVIVALHGGDDALGREVAVLLDGALLARVDASAIGERLLLTEIVPAARASRTALSISRCAVMPTFFRNFRTLMLKMSSSMSRLLCLHVRIALQAAD